MSNYTKTTDFAAKDSLTTGDAGKIIRGAEFGTEFDNIATAIATKADTAGPTLTGTTTFDTLSDGTIAVTAFVDEDDMSSDSATMLPTQQSVKAYVDSQATAQDLDFEADTGGPLSIDLDSETLTFTGGTGIDTSGVDNAVTFAIDNTVTTLTDTQTLTNKTLTSPTLTGTTLTGTTLLADLIVNNRQVATDDASGVNIDGNDVTVRGGASTGTGAGGSLIFQTTPADVAGNLVNTFSTVMTLDESGIDVAGEVEFDSLSGTGAVSVTDILDEDDMTSDSDTSLATQQSIKAYVDSQVAGADSLAEVLTNGNTTDGTDIAFGDNDKAVFGAGSDLQIYHDSTTNDSIITESGAGNLVLQGDSLRLTNTSGVRYLQGNSGAEVNLWHNGNKKLETTSTGIDVTGVITTDGMTTSADINFGDNNKAIFGTGSDLQLFHDGTRSYISDLGTGDLRLQTNELRMVNAANTEVGIKALEDGAVTLYYNGNPSIATSSSGIDVTGTATMDGLTVDGNNAGLTITGPSSQLMKIATTSSLDKIAFAGGDGTVEAMRIDSNGDISFYEDTGTTAKLFWDSSAESLGIGTSSPSTALHVNSGGTNDVATFESTDANAKVTIKDNTTTNLINANAGIMLFSADSTNAVANSHMAFDVDGTEAMRIDSSQNLLVGNTDTDPATNNVNGAAITAGGEVIASLNGVAAQFNRRISDGDIAVFKKGGTAVGRVGVLSSRFYIGSGDTGIKFSGADDLISPIDASDGTGRDAAIDLGSSSARFKDLYLSGGVYLGGSGSANKLDDYEEGTFTGAVADASSGGNESSSALNGTYVKVGAVVYVQFNVSNIITTGMTAGNDVFITGLPFASKSVSGTAKYTGTANLSVVTFEQTPFIQVNEGGTFVKIMEIRSGAGNDSVVVSQLSSGASDIHGNLVYETA